MEIAAVLPMEVPRAPQIAGLTHRGLVRVDNQDAFFADPAGRFAIVADGMGGHDGGATASRLACEAASELLAAEHNRTAPERALRAAFEAAFEAINTEALLRPELANMGTTLVCAALDEVGELTIAHLGDSRMYRLRQGELRCLTEDHNVLAELIRAGVLSDDRLEDNRRLSHLLTRAISPGATDRPDIFRTLARPGDRYLLCSDGLHGVVPYKTINTLLNADERDDEICRTLVEAALDLGAPDNITVVLMSFDP